MVYFLYILSVISFFTGIDSAIKAETVMHQIISSLSFVTASILWVGGAIVWELRIQRNNKTQHENEPVIGPEKQEQGNSGQDTHGKEEIERKKSLQHENLEIERKKSFWKRRI